MQERWIELHEFPAYMVSDHGRIMNLEREKIKAQTPNQQGIPSALFVLDGKHYRRSTALLVSRAFLPPPKSVHFDTPINLDGDRFNNHIDNLAWRPRWFAVKYHKQFLTEPRGCRDPIEDIETGEVFDTSWEAAIKYGLLDIEILLSMINNTFVFPTGQYFRHLDK